MTETSWRCAVIASLARDPERWRPLGEVFTDAVDVIPLHSAMRWAAAKQRDQQRRRGFSEEVDADRLDLIKAQWGLFIFFVSRLIDRQSTNRLTKRTDLVRLKQRDPCKKCGYPTYLKEWRSRKTHLYQCPLCDLGFESKQPPVFTVVPPLVVEPPTPPEPEPVPEHSIEHRPTLHLKRKHHKRPKHRGPRIKLVATTPPQQIVQKRPRTVAPPKLVTVSPPYQVVVVPPPRVAPTAKPLEQMNTISDIYYEFKRLAHLNGLIPQKILSDRKFWRKSFVAVEAGCFDEYKRMANLKQEIAELNYPNSIAMCQVLNIRSIDWMQKTTTDNQRRRWEEPLTEAYGFGALMVLSLALAGRIGVLRDDMQKLFTRFEPIAKQVKQQPVLRQRWLGKAKHMIGRFKWK